MPLPNTPLPKDITRVISKGRDRIVEIGSKGLMSHPPCAE